MGCSCQFFLCCVFLNWIHRCLLNLKFILLYYLLLSQYRRPLIAQPSPWRLKVQCMSPGSREPTVDLRSRLSVSSTDAAAAQSGLWLQITSHLSNCLWKFAAWSLVSFHIVQHFTVQFSDAWHGCSAQMILPLVRKTGIYIELKLLPND